MEPNADAPDTGHGVAATGINRISTDGKPNEEESRSHHHIMGQDVMEMRNQLVNSDIVVAMNDQEDSEACSPLTQNELVTFPSSPNEHQLHNDDTHQPEDQLTNRRQKIIQIIERDDTYSTDEPVVNDLAAQIYIDIIGTGPKCIPTFDVTSDIVMVDYVCSHEHLSGTYINYSVTWISNHGHQCMTQIQPSRLSSTLT